MIYRIILILIFNFFSIGLIGQKYIFRPLTMDNGLSNFVVTSFYKDSAGFMWIGTDISLDRFDGVNFKHFTFNSPEVNRKRVKAIAETTSGNLFVGNSIGLWKLNYSTAELDRFEPEIIKYGVSALKWDPTSKTLFIGSDKGLYILKNSKTEYVALDNDALSGANFVAGIAIDSSGNLWMTTRRGICFLNLKTRKLSNVCGFNYKQYCPCRKHTNNFS